MPKGIPQNITRGRKMRLMMVAQKIWAHYVAYEKKYAEVCKEANDLGMNIGPYGEPERVESYRKKAIECTNWTKLSMILSGGRNNITENNIPKKYAIEVNDYLNAVENILENLFSRRYNRNMRANKIEELKKHRKEFRDIQRKKSKKWFYS